MPDKHKIAFVYDWLDKWGGVERVLLTFHEMFPEADFFTSYFDSQKAMWASALKIKTSFIQKLPKFIKEKRSASLAFYPYVFESFDFDGCTVESHNGWESSSSTMWKKDVLLDIGNVDTLKVTFNVVFEGVNSAQIEDYYTDQPSCFPIKSR